MLHNKNTQILLLIYETVVAQAQFSNKEVIAKYLTINIFDCNFILLIIQKIKL